MKCTTLNQPIKLYEEFSDKYRSKAQQLCEHLIEDTNNFHYSSNQPIELMQINNELVIHFKDDPSRYIHLCKKPIGSISGFYINSEKTIAALLTQMPKTDFYTISLYELKKQSANILLRCNNVVPQIRTTYHSIYWINKSKSNRPYKLMMANKCGIIEVCGTNSGYDILSFVCSNDAVIVIRMTHGDNSRLLFFDDFGERDTRFKEITSSLAIDSMEITNTLLYAIVNSQLLIINFFTDIHDRQMIQSPMDLFLNHCKSVMGLFM